MEKYSLIISAINNGLKEFSAYLHHDYYFAPIDTIKISDKNISWNLTETGWWDAQFPSGGSQGVYFIFGRKKDNENSVGVYVGKASHSSAIGSRLDKHLNNPERDNKIYPMKDKIGNSFLLELVVTIPMGEELHFLAPALEEYLIYNLQNQNIYLLNAVGKQS